MAHIDGEVAHHIFATALEDDHATLRSGEVCGGDAPAVSRPHDGDIDLGEDLLWGTVVDQRLDGV